MTMCRMFNILYTLPRKSVRHSKWFFQKLFRGYSDCDIWGLDYHLAKLILKRLKAFYNGGKRCGYPGHLENEQEWNHILEEMIFAFEYVLGDYSFNRKFWKDDSTKLENKARQAEQRYIKGMHFFAEYFNNLWK